MYVSKKTFLITACIHKRFILALLNGFNLGLVLALLHLWQPWQNTLSLEQSQLDSFSCFGTVFFFQILSYLMSVLINMKEIMSDVNMKETKHAHFSMGKWYFVINCFNNLRCIENVNNTLITHSKIWWFYYSKIWWFYYAVYY
jgi:hypothetical protein